MFRVHQTADGLELWVLVIDDAAGARLQADLSVVDEAHQPNPVPLHLEQPAVVVERLVDELRLHRLERLWHRPLLGIGEVDQAALTRIATARPDGILPLLDLFFGAARLDRCVELRDVEVGIGGLVLLLDE